MAIRLAILEPIPDNGWDYGFAMRLSLTHAHAPNMSRSYPGCR